jgi:hypothetical protein
MIVTEFADGTPAGPAGPAGAEARQATLVHRAPPSVPPWGAGRAPSHSARSIPLPQEQPEHTVSMRIYKAPPPAENSVPAPAGHTGRTGPGTARVAARS